MLPSCHLTRPFQLAHLKKTGSSLRWETPKMRNHLLDIKIKQPLVNFKVFSKILVSNR